MYALPLIVDTVKKKLVIRTILPYRNLNLIHVFFCHLLYNINKNNHYDQFTALKAQFNENCDLINIVIFVSIRLNDLNVITNHNLQHI